MPRALIAQHHFQAVVEEGEEVDIRREARQRQPHPILDHQPDHAQSRAAQRIGVLAAGRLLVDRPEADEGVELVGERHSDRDRIGRDAVGGAERLVVFLDRGGDRGVLALQFRVFAAHQPLQFRELADHLGRQIGLGEFCRTFGQNRVGADDRGKLFGQRGDAPDALALRAELGVEDDAELVELGHALVERLRQIEPERLGALLQRVEIGQRAAIGRPEIGGVREAGAHDAAIAGGDRQAAIAGDEVRDRDEAVRQLARRGIAQHETFLVGADGGADRLAGNVEEALLEGTHQHDRPFDQPGDLLQQSLILDQFEPGREGEVPGVGRDDLLAAVGIEHDLRPLQARDIVVEAADRDRAGRVEAVAIGGVAGGDAVDLEGDDLRILGLGAEGAEDRVQWTDPAQAGAGGRGLAPAHRLRPGEGADHRRHDLGDGRNRLLPGLLDDRDVRVALLRIADDGRFVERGEAGSLEEALHRGVRRADARPLALLADIAPAHGEASDGERQPARRGEGFRALIDQAALDQRIGDKLLQILRRLALHAGGDLFRKEFEQEIRHQFAPPPAVFSQAAPQALASSRTRRI